MPRNVIADSSALIALVRHDDQHHSWINAQVDGLPKPWVTCEPALTEAFHMAGPKGTPAIKEILRRGGVLLDFKLIGELQQVLALMDKYSTVPMSLADACLVRMSEMLPDPILITTDADFRIYRRHGRDAVPCLMP